MTQRLTTQRLCQTCKTTTTSFTRSNFMVWLLARLPACPPACNAPNRLHFLHTLRFRFHFPQHLFSFVPVASSFLPRTQSCLGKKKRAYFECTVIMDAPTTWRPTLCQVLRPLWLSFRLRLTCHTRVLSKSLLKSCRKSTTLQICLFCTRPYHCQDIQGSKQAFLIFTFY